MKKYFIIISSVVLLFSCKDDDNDILLNQVGEWDITGINQVFRNDSLISSTNSSFSLKLNSDETGLLFQGTSGEKSIEWDIMNSGTQINIIEFSISQLTGNLEPRFKILDITIDEKNSQRWERDSPWSDFFDPSITGRNVEKWELSRK